MEMLDGNRGRPGHIACNTVRLSQRSNSDRQGWVLSLSPPAYYLECTHMIRGRLSRYGLLTRRCPVESICYGVLPIEVSDVGFCVAFVGWM